MLSYDIPMVHLPNSAIGIDGCQLFGVELT
jgi:hypothetical protein